MSEDSGVIERAKKLLKRDQDAWRDIYDKAAEDQRFLSDDKFAQWEEADYKRRTDSGRPAVTVDYLNQFIHQVCNDSLMSTPTINILPSDRESSQETAEVYKGLIREIEYSSNADSVYDAATNSAIRCSIGFMRVDHEYDGDGFNQVLRIKRMVNPLSVWLDSASIEVDGRDAKHCTIIEKITVERFKELYPDAEPSCFETDAKEDKLTDEQEISIAEHFYIEEEPEEISSEDGQKRTVNKKTVKRYKLSGKEILDETVFPGEYVPIVPVYGEESWVEGKRRLESLIRKAKPVQCLLNLWKSIETETLMNAPKAYVIAAAGQIEAFQDDWKNPDKAFCLRYDGDVVSKNGAQLPPPSRLDSPQIPMGVVNASRQCVEDIKSIIGIQNASLGMVDNAISGVAISKRQGEGDVATYHFADNRAKSITQVGRILVGSIPVIYDTPRIIQTMGAEEDTKPVGINGEVAEDQPATFDLTQGKYSVRVVTGASFSTKRQESADFLSKMIQSNPDFIKIAGDILFKNMDFSGAPAMAERIKKIMDPAILEENQQDPAVVQMQAQMQQMQAMIAAQQQQLNDKQAELQLKAQAEANDAVESKGKLEVQQEELKMKYDLGIAEITLKNRELELKEKELALKSVGLQAEAMQREAATQAAPFKQEGYNG